MLPPPKKEQGQIRILIAEDNEVSREMMAGILRTQGFEPLMAADGQEAIDIVGKSGADLALVDINMSPKGGFEFVRYMLLNDIDIPSVIVTSDESSDILIEANSLGISRVLQKPVEPGRLLNTVQGILRRRGINPQPMAVDTREVRYDHEGLMKRAISLANKNAQTRRGGPFGAVVADEQGNILGEGMNGITSRSDPTAHAEVMAIRQASERLGRSDLSDCILYVSSEPTMMGKALIISVGIKTVYFGLSHEEIAQIRSREDIVRESLSDQKKSEASYKQICHDEAKAMFAGWQAIKSDKVSD